jgi:hypothetical protein
MGLNKKGGRPRFVYQQRANKAATCPDFQPIPAYKSSR